MQKKIFEKFKSLDRTTGQFIFVTLTVKRVDLQLKEVLANFKFVLKSLNIKHKYLSSLIIETTSIHCHILTHGNMEEIKKLLKKITDFYGWTVYCKYCYAENVRGQIKEFNQYLEKCIGYIFKQNRVHMMAEKIRIYSNTLE